MMAPSEPVDRVRVRPARTRDLSSVAEIEASSYAVPWAPEAFRSLLGRPHVRFLVAEVPPADRSGAPTVVGYAIVREVGGEAELLNLAVGPSWRRQGVGAALLDRAVDELRAAGSQTVYLDVRDSNRGAIGLYRSRGFRQVAVRKHYYERPREDGLVLRLELTESGGQRVAERRTAANHAGTPADSRRG